LPGRGADARYGYPAVEGVPVALLVLNRNKKTFNLIASSGKVERLGPELGEHNAETDGGLLGLSEHQIGELQAEAVI
jgi:hypothetical protein